MRKDGRVRRQLIALHQTLHVLVQLDMLPGPFPRIVEEIAMSLLLCHVVNIR